MSKHAHYETFRRRDGKMGFRLRAANGRIVAQSQKYSGAPSKARRAIADHARAAADAAKQPIRHR